MLGFITTLLILLLILRYYSARRVILFYSPDCGYCRTLMPEWRKFEARCLFTIYPPISASRINIYEYPELAKEYGVEAVPFIIRLRNDGVANLYNGDRTYGDLWNWINS